MEFIIQHNVVFSINVKVERWKASVKSNDKADLDTTGVSPAAWRACSPGSLGQGSAVDHSILQPEQDFLISI